MRRPRRARRGVAPVLVTVAALVAASLSVAAPAAAARPRPDLVVVTAGVGPATVAPGAALQVRHAVRNTGRAAAGRSTTGLTLRAVGRVIRLGAVGVPALKARRTSPVRTVALKVPAATPAGSYVVQVCADEPRRVREGNERNNCRSAGTVTVQRPAPPVRPIPAMDTTGLQLDSFAATSEWPADESFAVQMLKYTCNAIHAVQPMTPAAARASLNGMLAAAAPEGVEALADSTAYPDVVALQQVAAAGVAQGSPGLALAALMRAHGLEPGNGTHLVNAASLAASIGRPNEALALLDEAAKKTFRAPAMGIPQQAIAATVRGQALVMTGRLDAARSQFLAAKAAAPLLTEADAGLANIEACKDEDEKAARFIRRSRQRLHQKVAPTEEPTRPDPASQIDLSAGHTTPLRQLPMAETPRQAVVLEPTYVGIEQGFLEEIDANNAARAQQEDILRTVDAVSTEAEVNRRHSIMMLAYGAHADPHVEAIDDRVDELLEDLTLHREEFWGGGTGEAPYRYAEFMDHAGAACEGAEDYTACFDREMNAQCRPALVGAHSQWRVMISELQNAANEWMALVSQQMSAIAANLEEESAHELLMLQIESLERGQYGLIVQQAHYWALQARIHEHHCVEPLPEEVPEAEGPPDAASAGNCPDVLKTISYKFALGPSEVKVNCEKIQQEFSTEVLPLVNAFAEVSYDFRSGTMTVVAGSKAKGGGGGVEGSFKSGIYITVGTRDGGSIKDVGWQVGPEVTASAGGVEAEVYKDEMDISFIAGLKGD